MNSKRMTSGVRTLLIAAALLVPVPGDAQTVDTLRLTWPQARSLLLRQNPEIIAARPLADIALGELRQSSLLAFNPSADVLSARSGLGREIGVNQEIEIAGQRGLRKAASRAGVARAHATIADRIRVSLGEAEREFYRLAAANVRLRLADEVVELNKRLTDITGRQLKEGEVSRLDYNLARVELGRSESRRLAVRTEQEQVELELRRALGLPQSQEIDPVADSIPTLINIGGKPIDLVDEAALVADLERFVDSAIVRRPDLSELGAAANQARAEARLAGRSAIPNVFVRAANEVREDGRQIWRPGFGMTIPIFNRNQGAVQARNAQARQAELQRQALVTLVRAEVRSALSAYHSASQRTRLMETSVLPQTRENRRLLEIAYREGKVGLPVLLLIRNQAIEAELEYWDAWLTQREALAHLAESTGANLND